MDLIIVVGMLVAGLAFIAIEWWRLRDPEAEHGALSVWAIYLLFAPTIFNLALTPSTGHSRENTKRNTCTYNARELGMALFMYASDHNERFPTSTWLDLSEDYLRRPAFAVKCPFLEEGSGYGLNDRLVGKVVEDNPQQILIAESRSTERNAMIHSEEDLIIRHKNFVLTVASVENLRGQEPLQWDESTPFDLTKVEVLPGEWMWRDPFIAVLGRQPWVVLALSPFVLIWVWLARRNASAHRRRFWIRASGLVTGFVVFLWLCAFVLPISIS